MAPDSSAPALAPPHITMPLPDGPGLVDVHAAVGAALSMRADHAAGNPDRTGIVLIAA